MASEAVLEITDDNFAQEVESSSVPVLVDFWAEWCQPCRMLTPIIEQLAEDFGDKAKIGKVDVDSNREIATKYQITSIPTVFLFHNGEIVERFVGLRKKEEFEAAINGLVTA